MVDSSRMVGAPLGMLHPGNEWNSRVLRRHPTPSRAELLPGKNALQLRFLSRTNGPEMEFATSYAQLSKATGLSRSTLHEKQMRGQIPERGPQGWRVDDVRAALVANTDPGRRSEARSAPSAARTPERSSGWPRIAETGACPTPEAYRDRADLPDAFIRGALFGAHAVAYGLPTAAACAAQEAGAAPAAAVKAYGIAQEDAVLLVAGLCEDLGLVPAETEDAGPQRPTAFQGFDSYFPLAELAA